jgi:hypothetical protein
MRNEFLWSGRFEDLISRKPAKTYVRKLVVKDKQVRPTILQTSISISELKTDEPSVLSYIIGEVKDSARYFESLNNYNLVVLHQEYAINSKEFHGLKFLEANELQAFLNYYADINKKEFVKHILFPTKPPFKCSKKFFGRSVELDQNCFKATMDKYSLMSYSFIAPRGRFLNVAEVEFFEEREASGQNNIKDKPETIVTFKLNYDLEKFIKIN